MFYYMGYKVFFTKNAALPAPYPASAGGMYWQKALLTRQLPAPCPDDSTPPTAIRYVPNIIYTIRWAFC